MFFAAPCRVRLPTKETTRCFVNFKYWVLIFRGKNPSVLLSVHSLDFSLCSAGVIVVAKPVPAVCHFRISSSFWSVWPHTESVRVRPLPALMCALHHLTNMHVEEIIPGYLCCRQGVYLNRGPTEMEMCCFFYWFSKHIYIQKAVCCSQMHNSATCDLWQHPLRILLSRFMSKNNVSQWKLAHFFVAAQDKSSTFSSLFHCCCFFPPLSVGLVSVRYKGWTLPASGGNSCGCGGRGGGGSPQSQG